MSPLVNSHDVEFTGDIKSFGKVSEKMKTLKEGNERAYEGVKVVGEKRDRESVPSSVDLETEKYSARAKRRVTSTETTCIWNIWENSAITRRIS